MPKHRVVTYFALVTLLAIPFWALGAFVDLDLLPGLPIAALAAVTPTLAAALLVGVDSGLAKIIEFLGRAMDARGAGWWVFLATIINPLLFGLAFAASHFCGADIPAPTWSVGSIFVLFVIFLPVALLEEVGWSGYALAGLQQHLRPLVAALLLGLFWAAWHIPALLQVGRSVEWIAWWSLWTVAARTIMVWLYNAAGASVLAVAFYHTTSNVCWQMYPENGSFFDPRVSAIITLGVASLAVVSSKAMTRRLVPND